MNNSITSSIFPDRAKVVTVVPIDKKTDNKYTVSKFRPVSLLNCFSKIYENYIKSHVVNSMNNYISLYVSAYRKGRNSQHVLIRLLEEWRQHLDNNKAVGGVFMDLSKAFNCVPHDLLIAKLAACSADENLLMHIYSYLSNRKQCVRMYTAGFKILFLGCLNGPLSALHYLTVSLMISFISSIKLVCIILLTKRV